MSFPFLRAFLLAISIVFSAFKTPRLESLLAQLPTPPQLKNSFHWLPIQQRINFKLATLVHCSLYDAAPQYMSSLLPPYTTSRQLRSASLNLLSQPRINITLGSRDFNMLALPFGIPSLIISDLPTLHCLQYQSKNPPFLRTLIAGP